MDEINTTNPNGAATPVVGDDGLTKQSEVMFTQAQIDSMIVRAKAQEQRNALDKHYAELGTTADDVKAILETHNTQKQSSLSELDKAQKALQEAQAKHERDIKVMRETLLTSTTEAVAASLGVPPQYHAHVLKLAELSDIDPTDREAIKGAVEKVLDDVPVFRGETERRGSAPTGANPGSNTASTQMNHGQQAAQRKKAANEQAQKAIDAFTKK